MIEEQPEDAEALETGTQENSEMDSNTNIKKQGSDGSNK